MPNNTVEHIGVFKLDADLKKQVRIIVVKLWVDDVLYDDTFYMFNYKEDVGCYTRLPKAELSIRAEGSYAVVENISDVLEMTIEEAALFFEKIPQIANKLETLVSVGLGYIQLGQSALTLSGGEAQRVKLANELAKRSTGKTLYVMDEPTTGLHFADVKQLMEVINRLVNQGNTVVMIEHNLDVILQSDYIIDLGPEGGTKGGTIIATGTPEEIAKIKNSHTGYYLKELLDRATL